MTTSYINKLRELVDFYLYHNVPLAQSCRHVLDDERFTKWPGGVTRHHQETGGLARHTLEVAEIAIDLLDPKLCLRTPIILAASIWHDYGKCWDYGQTAEGAWHKTYHYTHTHHVVRSYHEFLNHSCGVNPGTRDSIAHCILSHHGKLEWGSPVTPQTTEARVLHDADMKSMRANSNGVEKS